MRKHEDPDSDVGAQKVPDRGSTQTDQNGRREDDLLPVDGGGGVANSPVRSPDVNNRSKGEGATTTIRLTARQARQLRPMSDSEDDSSEDDSTTNSDVPGAFNVEGRNGPSDDGTVQYSVGISNENEEGTNPEEVSGEEKLVVAVLAPTTVEGTAILMRQDQEQQRRQQQEEQQQPSTESTNTKSVLFLLSGVFIGIVVTGIIVVIVVVVSQNGEATEAPTIITTQGSNEDLSQFPTTTTTFEQTLTPTIAPSLPPTTRLPTQMPTSAREIVMDALSPFIPDIPSTTIQQRALSWLIDNDDGLISEQRPDLLLERFVMAVMYYTMDGSSWDNELFQSWLSPSTFLCVWRDIRCDSQKKVVFVDLVADGLSGYIPSELATLTRLTHLSLGTNNLIGSIPSEIGRLTALTLLGLWINDLSGTIPSEVGELTNLNYLSLRSNNLDGQIPADLGRLSALTSLYLFSNNLSGSIPSDLIQLLESLNDCGLGNNPSLVGIPSSCAGCAIDDPC